MTATVDIDAFGSGESGAADGPDHDAVRFIRQQVSAGTPGDVTDGVVAGEVEAGFDELAAENQRLRAENERLRAENERLRPENQQLLRENQRLREAPDLLTGLMARGSWEAAASRMLLDAAHPALLFADVNRLKQVNDSLGHSAGDRLLRDFAAELRIHFENPFGSRALLGRISGDEFVVLIDESENSPLVAAAKQCVVNIDGIRCGGSFGLARPEDLARREIYPGEDLEEAARRVRGRLDRLRSAADTAMYRAKQLCHAGRITALEIYGPDDHLVPAEPDRDSGKQGSGAAAGFTYEETLLGSLIYAPSGFDNRQVGLLESEDFSTPRLADVHRVLRALYQAGRIVDIASLPAGRRVEATIDNQRQVFTALQRGWKRRVSMSEAARILSRLTEAAPPHVASYHGVFAPEAQGAHARRVLEESALRTCAEISAEMSKIPAKPFSFLPFVPATSRAVQRWAADRREGTGRDAERLADSAIEGQSADASTGSGMLARRETVMSPRQPDLPAEPRHEAVLKAETHLIHVALHSDYAQAESLLVLGPETFSTLEGAGTWQVIGWLHAENLPVNYLSVLDVAQTTQPPTPILPANELYKLGLDQPPNQNQRAIDRSRWIVEGAARARSLDSVRQDRAVPVQKIVAYTRQHLEAIEAGAASQSSNQALSWAGPLHRTGEAETPGVDREARPDGDAPVAQQTSDLAPSDTRGDAPAPTVIESHRELADSSRRSGVVWQPGEVNDLDEVETPGFDLRETTDVSVAPLDEAAEVVDVPPDGPEDMEPG